MQVDRVHRCQRNLKAAAGELQSRLQGEVMDQALAPLQNISELQFFPIFPHFSQFFPICFAKGAMEFGQIHGMRMHGCNDGLGTRYFDVFWDNEPRYFGILRA